MSISSLNNKNIRHLITFLILIMLVVVLTIEFNVVYNGIRNKTTDDETKNIVNQKGFEKIVNKIRR